jgi:hypothetical protein
MITNGHEQERGSSSLVYHAFLVVKAKQTIGLFARERV